MHHLVTQLFSVDHERIDFLFRMYKTYKASDRYKATLIFEKFCEALTQHIDWEEQLLFPAYNITSGYKESDSIALIYKEHQLIINKVDQIRTHLINQVDCSNLEYELTELMLTHNEKEEQILYGKCDQALTESRLVEILLEM